VADENIFISLVIPAYNESQIIADTIDKALAYLSKKNYSFEIIVVDDGSIDDTRDVVGNLSKKCPFLRLICNSHLGKGASVKSGVLFSRGEYVLFSDADLSTPLEELEKMLPLLVDDYDVVVGSRALTGSTLLKKQGWFRRTMGKTFNVFIKLLVFNGINDTQCGFKCFKKVTAHRLFSSQRLNGFCFDVEILYIAKKIGYRVKEIPISWANRCDSRVRLVRDSLSMAVDILRIKANELRGMYKCGVN